MKKIIYSFFFLLLTSTYLLAQEKVSYEVVLPEFIIEEVEYAIEIKVNQPIEGPQIVKINGIEQAEFFFMNEQSATVPLTFHSGGNNLIAINGQEFEVELKVIPLWLSIVPPLLAILLALVFREVVSSLLIGIFSGAVIIQLYQTNPLNGLLHALMDTIDKYILQSLNDSGHLSIILFSMLIGSMVSVISKNGGMQGVVNRISAFATNSRNGQLATWFLGVAIFFDDYANTLIVGNTMRPVTDRLKISREKLAYLVDSTAAPIAAIAFITTWIGAELGYIASGIENIEGLNEGAYATFISSLAFSFYPILALIFMLILILKERDFGPMYAAEKKARTETERSASEEKIDLSEFEVEKGIVPKAYNAVIPILTVVIGTIAGLLYTGWDTAVWNDPSLGFGRKLSNIIGNADSYRALLWSSLAGLIVAIKLSVLQRKLSLNKAVDSAVGGLKTMLPAVIILTLAWALAMVIEELHTADLITSLLSENISPYLLPAFTFILAALVAFSTGSSWGTMAILYPLMLPASWLICQNEGFDYAASLDIFHNVVACVLAGSVLGDHCSPISDTTILSSLASSCNHISHVRTQMPYALTVGIVAVLFGTIPSAFGVPFIVNLLLASGVLYLIIHFFGKKV